MKTNSASAFAPGHISGFFEPIFFKNDIFRTGSRGAGVNISLGAESEVIINKSDKLNIEIILNGKITNFPVISTALKYLVEDKPMKITVKTKLDLPLSQGFGMSAACAVSASYALSKIINKSYFEAMKASHYAEIIHKTGLGDVISCFFGGIEMRTKPGLPPWGIIQHILGEPEIVLCVFKGILETNKILNDVELLKIISHYGNYCIERLMQSPNIENFFSLSQIFTINTNIASNKILETIQNLKDFGKASMCMLGNSIFAIGDVGKICGELKSLGKIYICDVDKSGARIITI
jgi:pantoate kinase